MLDVMRPQMVLLEDIVEGVTLQNMRTAPTDPVRVQEEEEALKSLAASILAEGLIHPIIVMEVQDPQSGATLIEVVAGHRRLAAMRYLRREIDTTITSIATNCLPLGSTNEDAHAAMVAENIHREDVNPMDRAKALSDMVTRLGTQAAVAQRFSLSPASVSNYCKVATKALVAVQDALRNGKISLQAAVTLAGWSAQRQGEALAKLLRQKSPLDSMPEEEDAEDAISTKAKDDAAPSRRPGKKDRDSVRAALDEGDTATALALSTLNWSDGLLSTADMLGLIRDVIGEKVPTETEGT